VINNNYNSNINNCKRNLVFKTLGSSGPVFGQYGTAITRHIPFHHSSFFQRLLRFCIARERTGEKGNKKRVQERNRERKTKAFILPRDFVVVPWHVIRRHLGVFFPARTDAFLKLVWKINGLQEWSFCKKAQAEAWWRNEVGVTTLNYKNLNDKKLNKLILAWFQASATV